MRCRSCNEKWTLECGVGPGGSSSPGVILGLSVVLTVCGMAGWILGEQSAYSSLGAASLALLVGALLSLVVCLSKCGFQSPATCYVGSVCPKCGRKNWIWPWNL